MARKKRRRTTFFPTKIPINTLSGGVGRQAPNKRLPNEAENLDNVFCTTERSIDRRNGFSLLEGGGKLDIDNVNDTSMWWYWYNAGANRRYLFGVDTNATTPADLLHVFKIDGDAVTSQIVDNNIDQDIFKYLTHGSGNPKEKIRACSVGSTVLVLNTEVKAGFTSNGELLDAADGSQESMMYDLNGVRTTNPDHSGPELDYETAVSVDEGGEGEVWTEFSNYVWGQKAIDTSDKKSEYSDNDPDPDGRDNLRYGLWQVKKDVAETALPGPNNSETTAPSSNTTDWERVPSDVDGATNEDVYMWTEFISPDDYIYPNPLTLDLGQSVSRLSSIKFPLDQNDIDANNGGTKVERAFQALYPNSGNSLGKGKLYYLSQAYLSSTPGFYRAVSKDRSPYLEKVRTPDKMSVIDQNRMPMQIFLDTENNRWSIRKVDWNPRTSGTLNSNPGPSFFKDSKGNARQVEIRAISFYRDRLFLATDDTLVSSELGDYSNFFLKDPSNIVFTDCIDLSVSSNVYTPITFLKPFKDFLFLGTSGDTQYELIGSENQISPLTAEIAPTSFFPMTEDVEPMVMNNNLFFFSKKRLFIYFQRFEAAGQQAFELSRHVPDYLPERFWDTTVSTAHNTVLAIAGDQPSNKIFCYRNQVQADKITQNAFFTFTMPSDVLIQSVQAVEDDVYIVVKETSSQVGDFFQVQKMSFIPDPVDTPRIDSRVPLQFSTVEYNPTTNKTSFSFSRSDVTVSDTSNIIVFDDGSSATCELDTESSTTNIITFNVTGPMIGYESGWLGKTFTTEIELSTIFVRNQENNIMPGTLNLRYGVTRHRNTGNYDVTVSRKSRDAAVYKFEHISLGEFSSTLGGNLYEKDGTFKFPLMGFTDDIVVKIKSDYPNPLNITNIEVAGKFKRVPKFLTT
tara:strand:- start:2985 stop:5702 length:2718 start_codon:yes stop_codon:yes gene_type:complete